MTNQSNVQPTYVEAWQTLTPQDKPKRRIIGIVGGMEKTGKTKLAASFPGPVYVLGFDRGVDSLIQHTNGNKVINIRRYVDPRNLDNQASWKQQWQSYISDYYGVLEQVNQGTLVIDTETAAYEAHRYAEFGKLSTTPEQYAPVNAVWKGMVNAAFQSDMNVIFVRRAKPVYQGRQATGQWEDAGWSQMPYEVDVRIWTYKCGYMQCMSQDAQGNMLHPNGDGMHARIRESRYDQMRVIGMDLSNVPPRMADGEWILNILYDGAG